MPVKSAVLHRSTHITTDTRSHCTSVGYAGDITLAFITLVKTCFQSTHVGKTPRLGNPKGREANDSPLSCQDARSSSIAELNNDAQRSFKLVSRTTLIANPLRWL
ncbi:hypothetical protein FHS20_004240 [Phyllobacterium endophyticum]|nr:hypothetical protein [Phyllobacterium endophyticum]